MSVPPSIPISWINEYVGTLLAVAERSGEGPMRDAVLLRGNIVMDMVDAWKEKHGARPVDVPETAAP